MKKALSVIIIILCTLSISSCDISNIINQFKDESNDNGGNNADIKIEDESYKVLQQETTLVLSDLSDEIYNYFVFKIGEVARVPLAYHASEYHSGLTDTQYTWTDTTVNSTTLSETEAELTENTISAEIGSSIKSGFESSVGVEELGVSASMKSTLESELSSKIGTESKITNSNENQLEVMSVQEKRTEKTITIDKSSPRGHYWYAVCTSCDVYVALVCDKHSNTYEYYFITTSVGEKYDAMIYSGERDRLIPNIEEKLNFDATVFDDMDLFGDAEKKTYKAVINLEQLIDSSKELCSPSSDFSGDGYEYKKSEGVLYLYGKDNGKYFDSFKLVGNYGKYNDRDREITTVVDNMSIVIDTTHDVTLELERVAFKSNNGRSAIACTEETNENVTIHLISSGVEKGNKIQGGQSASSILDLSKQTLKISGRVPLYISPAGEYKSGADGIEANTLILNFNSSLTIEAGRGGDGSNGAVVSDGKNGLPGANGAHGGNAINVSSLDIVKCYALKLYAGSGGNGGNGSAGNNPDFNPLGTATPRIGGKGGNGGDGGCGILVYEDVNIEEMLSNVEIFVCQGGYGGNGGNGGAGGGSNHVGRGGDGGDGGYGGYACATEGGSKSYFDAYNGRGGSGGQGGCNTNDTSKNGANGQDR
ncbi:MAG: hypothetical protein J6Q85_00355 [Clostridia bacterium]|nr:hypothetical protein [Clostridia bacterium]